MNFKALVNNFAIIGHFDNKLEGVHPEDINIMAKITWRFAQYANEVCMQKEKTLFKACLAEERRHMAMDVSKKTEYKLCEHRILPMSVLKTGGRGTGSGSDTHS